MEQEGSHTGFIQHWDAPFVWVIVVISLYAKGAAGARACGTGAGEDTAIKRIGQISRNIQ